LVIAGFGRRSHADVDRGGQCEAAQPYDRRTIAFTSDSESGGPGLYLVSAQP
jgi:hypothetical protein